MRLGSSRLYVALVVALLAAAMIIRVVDPFFVHALRLIAFDWYQQLHPQTYNPESPVRIVDIDEVSLSKIGQWPWPRTTMRDLLLDLTSKGAAVIGFDVLFAEPDRTSLEEIAKRLPGAQASLLLQQTAGQRTNDQVFAAALQESPSVLAANLTDNANSPLRAKAGFVVAGDDPRRFIPSFSGVNGNLAVLDTAAHGIGTINWLPDRDQIVRRAPLLYRVGNELVPSLAAEVLRVAQEASTYVLKAANASGETAFGRNTGLNHLKIGDLEIPTDADGGIVLEFRPKNPAGYIPAWKVLSGEVSREDVAGRIILVGTSAPGLLTIAALFLGGWLAFRAWGLLLDPVYPGLALGCMIAGITFYVYRGVETQRSAIRAAFGHYLAPTLVEQLVHSPEKLDLADEPAAQPAYQCRHRSPGHDRQIYG